MKANARAAIAYIAVRLVTGRNATHIFDYGQSRYIPIAGRVGNAQVQVFDYEKGAHVSGSGNGRTFSLFNYGEGSHISLTIHGHQFQGFDYGSGSHFNGQISNGTVSLFD